MKSIFLDIEPIRSEILQYCLHFLLNPSELNFYLNCSVSASHHLRLKYTYSGFYWMFRIGHLPEAIRRESRTRLSTSLTLLARLLLARLLLLDKTPGGLFETEVEAKGLSARLPPALEITR